VCHEVPPAHQVVRGGAEGKHPIDETPPTVGEFAQQADGFHPPEGLLDQFPLALADEVPGVSHRAPVNGTAAGSPDGLRDMRRHVHRADRVDPVARIVQLSAPTVMRRLVNGSSPSIRIAASRPPVPVAAVTAVFHNQAVAILGEQVTQIAEFGFPADGRASIRDPPRTNEIMRTDISLLIVVVVFG